MTFKNQFTGIQILEAIQHIEATKKPLAETETPSFGGASLRQIAEHVDCSKNTAKSYVQKLIKAGYVTVEKVPWIGGFSFRYKLAIVYQVRWNLFSNTKTIIIAQSKSKNVAEHIRDQLKKDYGDKWDAPLSISPGSALIAPLYKSVEEWDEYFEMELKPNIENKTIQLWRQKE